MLGSILPSTALHSHSTKPSAGTAAGTRRNTYTAGTAPTLPPRRNSLSTAPAVQTAQTAVQLKTVTVSGGMESRHYRSSSPRRAFNPARASTGTFADPYASSYDYSTYRPSSPRASADRLSGASHHHSNASFGSYAPSGSSGSRASAFKYDAGYGQQTRPRRNTEDRLSRPNVASLTSLPLRTPFSQDHRPSSPLAPPRSSHGHGDTYITHGSSRQDSGSSHKKIYSVDSTHTAKLVAETDTIESPRHRDSGYGAVTSGRSSYHPTSSNSSKPPSRHADLGDNGYSYTDAAGMYRDTEPAWRRPRAGSVERGSRPSSMIVDRPPRTSTRESGPPPSTRGFDKINTGYPRPARSNSIERRERYQDPYASDSAPHRSSSTRHAPAVHQEPHREARRAETYDEYGRGKEAESKRHNTYDRGFEDREVASRGFGIATNPAPAQDSYAHDRQAAYPSYEPPREPQRAPQVEHTPSAYHSDRGVESRMPEPRRTYDSYEQPRSERPRTESVRDNARESRAIPVAAGALAGLSAATGIAAAHSKAKEKEREERGSSEERERQKRREYDERDRRDDRYDDRRDDRRSSRLPDERREPERREALPAPPPPSQPSLAPAAAAPAYAYAGASAPERPISRDRPYPNEENPPPKPPRKTSPEGSEVERPRHYADRESDRSRKEPAPAPAPAAVDPDEDYRRRLAQAEKEAEQSRRAAADRQDSDSDGGRDRRRRRDRADRERSRSRSRGREDRRERSPASQSQALSRYNERGLVEEPESVDKLNPNAPGKSVQIVVPRKDQSPPLRGILRKPTEKFPEDPEPIREGVAPHKDAVKGKDIPIGARWTRIDRKLVNPEALDRAKERFEERMDCVIVLRVLTKEEIQKLADKTKQIREERGTFEVPIACGARLTSEQKKSTSASAATATAAAIAVAETTKTHAIASRTVTTTATTTATLAAAAATRRATTTTCAASGTGSATAPRCLSLPGD